MKQGSTRHNGHGSIESTGSDVLTDADKLAEVYDEENGNVSAVARRLSFSKSHIRNVLVEHGIHDEITRTEFSLAARLERADPGDVGARGERV